MKKTLVIVNILLTFLLLAGLTASFLRISKQEKSSYYNRARVLLSEDLRHIEDKNYIEVSKAHPFCLLNLQGKVVFSSDSSISVGDVLSIAEAISTDHAFISENDGTVKLAFPILSQDGEMESLAVFTLEESMVAEQSLKSRAAYALIPSMVCCAVVIAVMAVISVMSIKRVFAPIKEMTVSADAIIKGDYTQAVVRKRTKSAVSGSIDELVYSFELMRDELKAKSDKEAVLKKSQKELLSCMSHDLRTPISTIKAHAEAIRDGLAVTQEKHDKYIGTIISKTDVLSRMISDLLDHSNAELNQLSIDKKEVYCREFLDTLSKELYIYCRGHGCDFDFDSDMDEFIAVIDKGRISQVIYNLVENAVKYADSDRKHISMKCGHDRDSGHLCISIGDNGKGVSMIDIPYVFDRFYRAEKSRSMQVPGAGLGLSICKYIVTAHGGEISLSKSKEGGAEFSFYVDCGE